eukprot:15229856-Heterocapsa_arctica.AAC.1
MATASMQVWAEAESLQGKKSDKLPMTNRRVNGEHTWSMMLMSEIENVKRQTLDTNEWGGFEHTVTLSMEMSSYKKNNVSYCAIATKANGENKRTLMT